MLDLGKQLTTAGGRSVRFLGKVNAKNPLVFAIMDDDGKERVINRLEDGTSPYAQQRDFIVNQVTKVTRYVNLLTENVLATGTQKVGAVRRPHDYECKGYSTIRLDYEDGKLVSSTVIR